MIHELQIWPEYFDAVKDGSKTFEVREKRDRVFKVGDYLYLKCYSPEHGYDGREFVTKVTYTLDDPAFCKEGYIIMGLG
jgi:hypothetical protein